MKRRQEKASIAEKLTTIDSEFEKLKLEFSASSKAEDLHKKIKNALENLEKEEKSTLLYLLGEIIGQGKENIPWNKDITIQEWLEQTSKKSAEPIVGKWHFKSLKLLLG